MRVEDLDTLVETLRSAIRENSVCIIEEEEEVEVEVAPAKSTRVETVPNPRAAKPPKKPKRGGAKQKTALIDRGAEVHTILVEEQRNMSHVEILESSSSVSQQVSSMSAVSGMSAAAVVSGAPAAVVRGPHGGTAGNIQTNLTELDSLLADLNSAQYMEKRVVGGGHQSVVSNSYAYGDYYSDLESYNDDRPPNRPPPPANYSPGATTAKKQRQSADWQTPSQSPLPPMVTRKPRRPPKLMHVLKEGEKRKVHDLAKENREEDLMDIEVPDDGTDYGDYTSKWEYLGKGIWENQDYGTVSNYSTLQTNTREDYDYTTLSKSPLPIVSDEELEKETGAGPRGERSKIIPTDHGEVKSKYHYLGFGLWENTDPTPRPKPKKPTPPPPPPKAEPVWYNCTVQVSTTLSSKELDELVMTDNFANMPSRKVEVAEGIGDLGAGIGEPFEYLEKEDMSDMFRRAMLEKMQLVDDDKRAKYSCHVCNQLITGRVITAMANKFHPACFVCTYCRKEFKDRRYKTDPRDQKPYCFLCFEKLLGHFGTAHGRN